MAQVAHAADVDVAHRVVVSTRKDREEVEVLRGSHGVVGTAGCHGDVVLRHAVRDAKLLRVHRGVATPGNYGRTVAVHDLLKGREYNRNKAMEGFDEVNDPRIARAVHQGGYADVLLRPTMVGILRCGKMLPPQLNLVIEIEFADATTALWSENAGAHPAGATLSTDFEIQNVRVLASQVVLDSALVESFNRVLLSGGVDVVAALAVGEDLDALDEAGGVGRGRGQRVGAVRVPDAEGDLDGLGVDEGRAAGQRDAADPRGCGGEGAQRAGEVLHVMPRRHVAGVACFQLVVQALHQLILGERSERARRAGGPPLPERRPQLLAALQDVGGHSEFFY